MPGLIPYEFARHSRTAILQGPAETRADPVKVPVDRLDLERYNAIIERLKQFGDRRQRADRNQEAISRIEVQLKRYGCANG